MRRLLICLLAIGVAVQAAPIANAHAILTDSFPVRHAVVSSMPSKVWLEFDGNLTQIAGKKINFITLSDSSGRNIPLLKDYVGGARITAELSPTNITGKVTMSWRVVSEDGHPVSGSIFFTISPKKMGK